MMPSMAKEELEEYLRNHFGTFITEAFSIPSSGSSTRS
jgi:hypothetical protein